MDLRALSLSSTRAYNVYCKRATSERNLTVDRRTCLMDRTILPLGLYDPRGEREYLPLVHRQISPRSRISLFHFIYDKVGGATVSPVCRSVRGRLVGWLVGGACVWATEEGGCPLRFGFRRGGRERERVWVFAAIKRAYLIKPGPGIDGASNHYRRYGTRASINGLKRAAPKILPIVTGFLLRAMIPPNNIPSQSAVDKFDRVKMQSSSPRLFSPLTVHRSSLMRAHLTRAANFASLSTTNNEPGILYVWASVARSLQISRMRALV